MYDMEDGNELFFNPIVAFPRIVWSGFRALEVRVSAIGDSTQGKSDF
jgi:hypothetical protein